MVDSEAAVSAGAVLEGGVDVDDDEADAVVVLLSGCSFF